MENEAENKVPENQSGKEPEKAPPPGLQELTVPEEADGQRMDRFLAARFPAFSRSRLKGLIATGRATVDGKQKRAPALRLKAGQVVAIHMPGRAAEKPEPEDIPLDIVYEDAHLLVVNKAPGLVVHPGSGVPDGTLVNALLHHCGVENLSTTGGAFRPGIVHRLDKDTSGLMICAKTDAAHEHLAAQLKDRSLSRRYHAMVWGVPDPREGRIETQIGRHPKQRKKMAALDEGGKHAVTDYTTVRTFGGVVSLVECNLQTGRTHQIRVHMLHIRNWVVGDKVYGRRRKLYPEEVRGLFTPEQLEAANAFPRQALHALSIRFIHPDTGEEMSFETELPADMRALVDTIS